MRMAQQKCEECGLTGAAHSPSCSKLRALPIEEVKLHLEHLLGERDEEIQRLKLQVGELRKLMGHWSTVELALKAQEETKRLLGRYQKALEEIAAVDPRYPDGDAMSDEMCAKIALGRNCYACGSTLPCREHKEQQTERPVCDCEGDEGNDHTPWCKTQKPNHSHSWETSGGVTFCGGCYAVKRKGEA